MCKYQITHADSRCDPQPSDASDNLLLGGFLLAEPTKQAKPNQIQPMNEDDWSTTAVG